MIANSCMPIPEALPLQYIPAGRRYQMTRFQVFVNCRKKEKVHRARELPDEWNVFEWE